MKDKMTATVKVTIQKTSTEWGCCTTVQHPGVSHSVDTHQSFGTLKSALWHTVLGCGDAGWVIESVTVNGKVMPSREVRDRVKAALRDTPLDYLLDGIKEVLGL